MFSRIKKCSNKHIQRHKKTIKAGTIKPKIVWSRTLRSLNIDQLPLSVDDKLNLVYRIGEIGYNYVKRYLQQGRVLLILTHPRNENFPALYDKIQNGVKIAIANFESILPALSTNLEQLLGMLHNFEMIETSVENQRIESIKLEQTVRYQSMRLREADDELLFMNMTLSLRYPLPPFDDATDLKNCGDNDFYNLIIKYMDMHSHELHAPIIKPSYRKDLLKILDEKYTLQLDTRINLGSMEYRHLLLILNQLYIHTPLGHSIDSKKKSLVLSVVQKGLLIVMCGQRLYLMHSKECTVTIFQMSFT